MIPEKIDANARIRQTQQELGLGGVRKLPFLCECDDVRCRTLMQLTAAEYDLARAAGDRCIVARGHPFHGRVVLDGDGYAVVEE